MYAAYFMWGSGCTLGYACLLCMCDTSVCTLCM